MRDAEGVTPLQTAQSLDKRPVESHHPVESHPYDLVLVCRANPTTTFVPKSMLRRSNRADDVDAFAPPGEQGLPLVADSREVTVRHDREMRAEPIVDTKRPRAAEATRGRH